MPTKESTQTKEIDADIPVILFTIFMVIMTFIFIYWRFGKAINLRIKRLMAKNVHVVIMSTYGPSVEESPFYEAYVAKAMSYIMDPANKVSELIIVGGYTVDPSRPQSRAVLDYIEGKYPTFKKAGIPVTLDECGITTWQNVQNAKKLMNRESISAGRITLFAEASREKRMYFFANTTFKDFIGDDKNSALREVKGIIPLSREEQLKSYDSLQGMVTGEYTTKNAVVDVITESAGLPQTYNDDEHIKIFQEVREYLDPPYGNAKVKERLDTWGKTAGFDTVKNLVEKGCGEYKQFLNK